MAYAYKTETGIAVCSTIPTVPHIEVSEFPDSRLARSAWDIVDGKLVTDLTKAKDIAHGIRREARLERFQPHDDIIAKQVPNTDAGEAENARVIIRTRDDEIQLAIDNALTVDQLFELLNVGW